jgi:hypothetical protein
MGPENPKVSLAGQKRKWQDSEATTSSAPSQEPSEKKPRTSRGPAMGKLINFDDEPTQPDVHEPHSRIVSRYISDLQVLDSFFRKCHICYSNSCSASNQNTQADTVFSYRGCCPIPNKNYQVDPVFCYSKYSPCSIVLDTRVGIIEGIIEIPERSYQKSISDTTIDYFIRSINCHTSLVRKPIDEADHARLLQTVSYLLCVQAKAIQEDNKKIEKNLQMEDGGKDVTSPMDDLNDRRYFSAGVRQGQACWFELFISGNVPPERFKPFHWNTKRIACTDHRVRYVLKYWGDYTKGSSTKLFTMVENGRVHKIWAVEDEV